MKTEIRYYTQDGQHKEARGGDCRGNWHRSKGPFLPSGGRYRDSLPVQLRILSRD